MRNNELLCKLPNTIPFWWVDQHRIPTTKIPGWSPLPLCSPAAPGDFPFGETPPAWSRIEDCIWACRVTGLQCTPMFAWGTSRQLFMFPGAKSALPTRKSEMRILEPV